jgi:hypothetical protein
MRDEWKWVALVVTELGACAEESRAHRLSSRALSAPVGPKLNP